MILWVTILDLVLILAITKIFGDLAIKLKNARVVGQILGGILIGPSVLGKEGAEWLFPAGSRIALDFMARVGLMLYTYEVGLAFNPRSLRGYMGQVLATGISAVVIPGVLCGVFTLFPPLVNAPFEGSQGRAAYFMAAFSAGSVSALPVAALMLEDRGMTKTPAGVVCIAAAALVTVCMFVLLGVASALAPSNNPSWLFPMKMGLLLLLLLTPLLSSPIHSCFSAKFSIGPRMKFLLALLALLAGCATEVLECTSLLGPFILGVTTWPLPQEQRMSLHPGRELTTLYLLPIFFGMNGLSANLRTVVAADLPGIVLMVFVAMLGKALTTFVGRAVGMTWRAALVQAVLLNCRGLLVLVVNMKAMTLSLYGSGTVVAFLLLGLVSTAVTVPLLNCVSPNPAAPPPAPALPTTDTTAAATKTEEKDVTVALTTTKTEEDVESGHKLVNAQPLGPDLKMIQTPTEKSPSYSSAVEFAVVDTNVSPGV